MSLWNRLFAPDQDNDPMRTVVASAELVADSQINQAARVGSHHAQIRALRRQVDQMELVIEALLRELEARGGLNIAALTDRITQLDTQDGQADDRMDATVPRRLQE